MNYIEWNKTLYNFYFNNSIPVVYISLTKKKLAELGNFSSEKEAFEDFKNAVNNFPQNEHESIKFKFLTEKIKGYNDPSSILAKARNFQKAWGVEKYIPFQGAAMLYSWDKHHEPPYIAYISSLVLSIEDLEDYGDGYWKNFEKNFGKKGSGYGDHIHTLFADLKRHNRKFDFYSIYPSNIHVGTIYSQMPLTEQELKQLRLFFIYKEKSYQELLKMNDEELLQLLIENLDANFANSITIDALHDDSDTYSNFKSALPEIIKRLIPEYDLHDENLKSELDKILESRIKSRKYPMLLSFYAKRNDKVYLPDFNRLNLFNCVVCHGSNTDLDFDNLGRICMKWEGVQLEMIISPESKYSSPVINKTSNPFSLNQRYYLNHSLKIISSTRNDNFILFVPSGSVGAIPGFFMESPQKYFPADEPCVIFWKSEEKTVSEVKKFLDACNFSYLYPDNSSWGGWKGACFRYPSLPIADFELKLDKEIRLYGGVKTDPKSNKYFHFALPKLVLTNFTPDDRIAIYSEAGDFISEFNAEKVGEIILSDLIKKHSEVLIRPKESPTPYRKISVRYDTIFNPIEYPSKQIFENVYYEPKIHSVKQMLKSGIQVDKVISNGKEYFPEDLRVKELLERVNDNSESAEGDRLLTILTIRKKFNKSQFNQIVDYFHKQNAFDGSDGFTILNKLVELGHIQRISGVDEFYEVTKPRFSHLISNQNYMMLCGARTPEFINGLTSDLREDKIEYEIYHHDDSYSPKLFLIKLKNRNIHHKTFKFYESGFESSQVLRYLNSIPTYNLIEQKSQIDELYEETNKILEKFDLVTNAFASARLRDANKDTEINLYRYKSMHKFNRNPNSYFLKKSGKFIRLENTGQQEALYFLLAMTDRNYLGWIYHDSTCRALAIPLRLSLPEITRNAMAMSGCISKMLKVKKRDNGYLPELNERTQMMLASDEKQYLHVNIYVNVQEFIYMVLRAKFNKQFIETDLSNLLKSD